MTVERTRGAEVFSPLMKDVSEALGSRIESHASFRGEDTIKIARDKLAESAAILRHHPRLDFDLLVDVTALDYYGQPDGFSSVAEIWDRKAAPLARVSPSRHDVIAPPRGPLPRFAVVYHLLSTAKMHRLRIKCRVPETEPTIASLVNVWEGANWLERETWDMYGIRFIGHPDLRRIYLYEEFKGFPLRKDYPKRGEQPIQAYVGPGANQPRRPE